MNGGSLSTAILSLYFILIYPLRTAHYDLTVRDRADLEFIYTPSYSHAILNEFQTHTRFNHFCNNPLPSPLPSLSPPNHRHFCARWIILSYTYILDILLKTSCIHSMMHIIIGLNAEQNRNFLTIFTKELARDTQNMLRFFFLHPTNHFNFNQNIMLTFMTHTSEQRTNEHIAFELIEPSTTTSSSSLCHRHWNVKNKSNF